MAEVNEALARKVLGVVDRGLVRGLGVPTPGYMCVEAAVSYALDEPHTDRPSCVADTLRAFKVALNDSMWSTPAARANGMRRLAVAQLGSKEGFDEAKFAYLVAKLAIRKVIPAVLRGFKEVGCISNARMLRMERLAEKCELEQTEACAHAATDEVDSLSDWAYRSCSYAVRALLAAQTGLSEDAVYHAAESAHIAADFIYSPTNGDEFLAEFAEEAVQILIEMKAPGCQWLPLTEEATKAA